MHKLMLVVSLFALGLGREAKAADIELQAPLPPPLLWSWSGGYIGAHLGAGWGTTDFADPFGASIFGDNVRTPAFLGGGQIGYNWQAPGSSWVFGAEAEISGFDSDGTNTCFAASAFATNATCEAQPQVAGTLTGRIGYALGPAGHTLAYVRGGLAWVHDKIDMAQNSGGLLPTSLSSSSVTLWGGIVGAGIEQALTPAWSLRFEYDYLGFGSQSVTNVGTLNCVPVAGTCVITSTVPPGSSGVTQNIQEFKVGLNYRFAADPWERWPPVDPANAFYRAPTVAWTAGWELEAGGRYFGSWGQFHKDLGNFTNSGLLSISSVSRLTYDGMQTNAGELFGRIETPWNGFVKGFIGGGRTGSGHMNDEDFFVTLGAGNELFPYSNTLSSTVTGTTSYGVIDAGFDFLRSPGYKLGVFAGYFYFHQNMSAFGCTPIAAINCTPPVPTSGSPGITEDDKWSALRIGIAGETMLTENIKLSGEVAYLPWVKFTGVDDHFFGNLGMLAEEFPASGNGQGVQLEALLSYYFTPQLSIGVGGRYWAMWTTSGTISCTFDVTGNCGPTPTPPQFFKAVVEQAGVIVQASYRFDSSSASVTK
jgi:opacity protein-like surface antigen/outer membrane protease